MPRFAGRLSHRAAGLLTPPKHRNPAHNPATQVLTAQEDGDFGGVSGVRFPLPVHAPVRTYVRERWRQTETNPADPANPRHFGRVGHFGSAMRI
jgi:hypothetical protein